MFERFCTSINKTVLERPETGSRSDPMPPRLTHDITEKDANFFRRNKIAKRECVLTHLKA